MMMDVGYEVDKIEESLTLEWHKMCIVSLDSIHLEVTNVLRTS